MPITTAIVGVCLALASSLGSGESSANARVFVPVQRFTLAWTHSIEKIRWEEDYEVIPGKLPGAHPALKATAARIHGSGAGMEPPDDARLVAGGWYEYTPQIKTPKVLRLTRSEFTADYDWCAGGRCRPMSELLASDGDITLLTACAKPAGIPGG